MTSTSDGVLYTGNFIVEQLHFKLGALLEDLAAVCLPKDRRMLLIHLPFSIF